MEEKGYKFVEDSGRGYRRVVPSPMPINIVELDSIETLIKHGTLVIAWWWRYPSCQRRR